MSPGTRKGSGEAKENRRKKKEILSTLTFCAVSSIWAGAKGRGTEKAKNNEWSCTLTKREIIIIVVCKMKRARRNGIKERKINEEQEMVKRLKAEYRKFEKCAMRNKTYYILHLLRSAQD